MARTWLSIRVELVEGRGERLWPRPGRLFAAARGHSFAALGTAIERRIDPWPAGPDLAGRVPVKLPGTGIHPPRDHAQRPGPRPGRQFVDRGPVPSRVRHSIALAAAGHRLHVVGGSTGSTIDRFEMLVVPGR